MAVSTKLRLFLGVAIALTSIFAAAQGTSKAEKLAAEMPASMKTPGASPEAQALASNLLIFATARVNSLDPPMQAALAYVAGEAYRGVDPQKSRDFLSKADEVVKGLKDEDQPGISLLRHDLAAAMAADSSAKPQQTTHKTRQSKPVKAKATEQMSSATPQEQESERIVNASSADPQQALTSAQAISDPAMRVHTLVGIANALRTSNGVVARQALNEAQRTLQGMPEATRVDGWLDIATANALTANRDAAEDAIEQAIASGRALYREESPRQNPKKTLKLYWVTTAKFRDIIETAATFSSNEAMLAVDGVPDGEIRTLCQVFLTETWSKQPVWRGSAPIQ